MKFFKILSVIKEAIYFAVILVIVLNASVLMFILDPGSAGPRTDRLGPVSLYGSQKDVYLGKIMEARSLFRIRPEINDPFFAINFASNSYNAQYEPDLKCVILNGRLVRDFSVNDLAAVIGHEFAHAERVEKIGFEDRFHWQVDVRAAELTDPRWVESFLLTFIKEYPQVREARKSAQSLKSYGLLFLPAIWYVEVSTDDFDERLRYLREATGLPH